MKLTSLSKILTTVSAVAITQLGQSVQAAENIPGVAEQPAAYFYTGKPYDSDLGSYTFNARNYSPEINRWTSADPSGFPDGANNQFYAPIPLNDLDPNGLWRVVKVSGNTDSQNQSVGQNFPIPASAGLEGLLTVQHDSFSASANSNASTSLLFFGSATASVDGNLTATSDGRIQLTTNRPGEVKNDNNAQAGVGVSFSYQNNQKEVTINITWGGANTLGGSVSLNGSGASASLSNTGTLSYSGGFNTLIYKVVE